MTTQENTQQKTYDNQNVEVGALWKRSAKSNGQIYLAGHVKYGEVEEEQTMKVVVFSNKNKTNESAPDYRMYLSKPRTEETNQNSESEQFTAKEEAEELI